MMFLYFIAEVVMAYFALTKYDISEEVKQCNCEDDFERIHSYVHKRRKITLVFIVILLLMSSFQAIDWLRMCSSRAGFQTILNQDVDSTFQGFLFFANVVVAVTSIVYIIKIVNELSKNGLDALLRERITEVDSFNNSSLVFE